ncbi:hypothetical protein L6R50_03450 [Myxococcota bacterium]|nr:hypothetical protein [Myxococcota bacterium]
MTRLRPPPRPRLRALVLGAALIAPVLAPGHAGGESFPRGPVPPAVTAFDESISMERITAFLAEKKSAPAPAAAASDGASFAVVLPVQTGFTPDRVYDKRPVVRWTAAPGATAYRVRITRSGAPVLSETVASDTLSLRPRFLLDPGDHAVVVQAVVGGSAGPEAKGAFVVPGDDERAVLAGRLADVRRALPADAVGEMQCAAHWLAGYHGDAITSCFEAGPGGAELLARLLADLGNPAIGDPGAVPARRR